MVQRSNWKWKHGILATFFLVVEMAAAPSHSSASEGRQLFIEKCGSCHGTGKMAAVINPGDLASNQWEGFYNRKKHQRKKDISDRVNDSEWLSILSYLVKNAADADHPEVAAIP